MLLISRVETDTLNTIKELQTLTIDENPRHEFPEIEISPLQSIRKIGKHLPEPLSVPLMSHRKIAKNKSFLIPGKYFMAWFKPDVYQNIDSENFSPRRKSIRVDCDNLAVKKGRSYLRAETSNLKKFFSPKTKSVLKMNTTSSAYLDLMCGNKGRA